MRRIELAEVRDTGQTIGDAILFARQNLKIINRAFLYYLVPLLLVGAAFSAFGFKGIFGSLNWSQYGQYGSTVTDHHSLMGSGLMLGAGYIIFIVASVIQNVYVCEFMILYERNNESTLADIWSAIRKDWKRILATYLVMLPLGLTAFLVYFLIGWMADNYDRSVAGLVALVFLILLLYTIIPLSNLMMIRLRERLGIFQSIAKSFRITAGRWWSTFFSYFIMMIVYYSFMVILVLPFYVITLASALHGRGMGQTGSIGGLMGVYLTLVGFWVVYLWHLFYIYLGTNYYSLSERYDNYHLREEIMMIGAKDTQPVQRQEGDY